jgi:hypothetical protein
VSGARGHVRPSLRQGSAKPTRWTARRLIPRARGHGSERFRSQAVARPSFTPLRRTTATYGCTPTWREPRPGHLRGRASQCSRGDLYSRQSAIDVHFVVPRRSFGVRSRCGSPAHRRRLLCGVAVAQSRAVRAGGDHSVMSQNFIECDRDQELLLPPSLREWLPV